MARSSMSRRRFTPAALTAGLAGTALLSISLAGSLSGLIATITNTTNTAASAALAFTETGPGGTCNSYDATSTCSTINKYGGTGTPLVPGGTAQTVTVTLANTGTVSASTGTLTPGVCSASATAAVGSQAPTTPNTTAGNLCSALNIAVYKGTGTGGAVLYNGSAAAFTAPVALNTGLTTGTNQAYTFVTSLPLAATSATQGQQVLQTLTWSFSQ